MEQSVFKELFRKLGLSGSWVIRDSKPISLAVAVSHERLFATRLSLFFFKYNPIQFGNWHGKAWKSGIDGALGNTSAPHGPRFLLRNGWKIFAHCLKIFPELLYTNIGRSIIAIRVIRAVQGILKYSHTWKNLKPKISFFKNVYSTRKNKISLI